MKKLRSILHEKKQLNISVFFPCFNDAFTIKRLVQESFAVLKEVARDYEVIIVDDGSTDGSREILQNLAKNYNKLKLIFHEKNQGYGGALKSGFKAASKDLVFYTDGDGQYDVKELPILLVLMTDDVDFINGIKMSRKDPTYRIVLGKLYSMITRWSFWLPVDDVDCDFRLIRKELIDKLDLKSNSGSICVELVKKAQMANGKFREVSVHHYERKFGNSQFFSFNRLIHTFWELLVLWAQLMIAGKIRL